MFFFYLFISELIYPIPTWKEREYPSYPIDEAEVAFTVIPMIFIFSSLVSSSPSLFFVFFYHHHPYFYFFFLLTLFLFYFL